MEEEKKERKRWRREGKNKYQCTNAEENLPNDPILCKLLFRPNMPNFENKAQCFKYIIYKWNIHIKTPARNAKSMTLKGFFIFFFNLMILMS